MLSSYFQASIRLARRYVPIEVKLDTGESDIVDDRYLIANNFKALIDEDGKVKFNISTLKAIRKNCTSVDKDMMKRCLEVISEYLLELTLEVEKWNMYLDNNIEFFRLKDALKCRRDKERLQDIVYRGKKELSRLEEKFL